MSSYFIVLVFFLKGYGSVFILNVLLANKKRMKCTEKKGQKPEKVIFFVISYFSTKLLRKLKAIKLLHCSLFKKIEDVLMTFFFLSGVVCFEDRRKVALNKTKTSNNP